MDEEKKRVDSRNNEDRSGDSMVGSTLIKYTAYLVIFFGVLWFLINYILPRF